jgi:fucose permease
VAWIDRVNIGFAKLQMLDDLKFTEAVYGLGAGIFFLGYFFFEVPSNLLLEKFGRKKPSLESLSAGALPRSR